MWKKVPFLLGILEIMVMFFPGVALAGLWDYYPEYDAFLLLSRGDINMGLPVPQPSGGDYWEAQNALFILFRCPREHWQVILDGDDFVSGQHSIPRHWMEWRAGSGDYQSMKPAGYGLVLARSEDFPDNILDIHYLFLSFRLLLPQWKPAGEYASEMQVTLFCW
ncbi:MAG: hypothetical protein GX894_07625 [Clostridia bacterium]|nr:hypothetical protein [Clostridia bacterium]